MATERGKLEEIGQKENKEKEDERAVIKERQRARDFMVCTLPMSLWFLKSFFS